MLSCLPAFLQNSRDDHIFGAARYLANTLGILIQESPSANLIDTPMSNTEAKQTRRKAAFLCRCKENVSSTTFEIRTFYNACSYLIPCRNNSRMTYCPGCNLCESWEHLGHPCLACQLASIASQNPFAKQYQIILDTWLPTPSDFDSNSSASSYVAPHASRKTYQF
jgi:hypothetical protein